MHEKLVIKYLISNKMDGKWHIISFDYYSKGLSCEYMQCENENNYNYLVCFFIISKDNKLVLSNNYFQISPDSIASKTDFKADFLENINDVVQIQSVAKEDRRYSFVCLLFSNGDLKCYKFYFKKQLLSGDAEFSNEKNIGFNCKNVIYGLKLNYLADGETISLSCINSYNNIQVQLFNKEFNALNTYIQFSQCGTIESIYGHSILNLIILYILFLILNVIIIKYVLNF